MTQLQVAYCYLLSYSWYTSAENMNLVRVLGHHFVFALESSRTIALSEGARAQGQFQAVQSLAFPDTHPLQVYIADHPRSGTRDQTSLYNKDGNQGMLYPVSSDTDLSQAQLTMIYKRRWKVEEYHKSLRKNASIGKSPTKTLTT